MIIQNNLLDKKELIYKDKFDTKINCKKYVFSKKNHHGLNKKVIATK